MVAPGTPRRMATDRKSVDFYLRQQRERRRRNAATPAPTDPDNALSIANNALKIAGEHLTLA